jgi:endo-1,4-beta-xylanase
MTCAAGTLAADTSKPKRGKRVAWRLAAGGLALAMIACLAPLRLEPTPTPTSTATATPPPTLTPSPTPPPTSTPYPTDWAPPLRVLADLAGLELGTQLTGGSLGTLYDAKPLWRQLLVDDFNSVTIDWGIYWPDDVEPLPGEFNFALSDRQVSFAQANGLTIRGHALIYPTCDFCMRGWIVARPFSADELSAIIQAHVAQVVGHFRGQVNEWVVVNEPYHSPGRENDIFYQALGADYVGLAFEAARAADPSALLLYNDTDNHTLEGAHTPQTWRVAKRLAALGLIDGIGLQMHIDGSQPPSKEAVITAMRSYGVAVYITEFDVDLTRVSGLQSDREALQAAIYRDMLEACLESEVCKGFTVWGLGDKYSWLEAFQALPNADPTMFDDNLQPKPAYDAVYDTLLRFVTAGRHVP